MDKDDFQAWKDSPETREVIRKLSLVATRMEQACKDQLMESAGSDPQAWAALQSKASFDRGYVQAIREIEELDFDDISEDEPQRD